MKTYHQPPYFESDNENTGYVKVLFKAGEPIQARELNETASLLQSQIESLGSHIFKAGSRIAGGTVKTYNAPSIKTDIASLTLEPFFRNEESGSWAVKCSNGAEAFIVASSSFEDIILDFYKGVEMPVGQAVDIYDPAGVLQHSGTVLSVSTSTYSEIGQGVFFVNGYFVKHDGAKTVISYTEKNPSGSYGFIVSEDAVDYLEDNNLLDNATGYPGQGMPGADRVKIRFSPVFVTNQEFDASFIKVLEFADGNIIYKISNDSYNTLGDYLNARTFEESGNYTVGKPDVSVMRHLKNSLGDSEGLLLANEGGIEDKMVAVVSPMKAYRLGKRIATEYPVAVELPARKLFNPKTISMNIGSSQYCYGYTVATDIAYFPETSTMQEDAFVEAFGKTVNVYSNATLDANGIPTSQPIGSVTFFNIFDIKTRVPGGGASVISFKVAYDGVMPESLVPKLMFLEVSPTKRLLITLSNKEAYERSELPVYSSAKTITSSGGDRLIEAGNETHSVSNVVCSRLQTYSLSTSVLEHTISPPVGGKFVLGKILGTGFILPESTAMNAINVISAGVRDIRLESNGDAVVTLTRASSINSTLLKVQLPVAFNNAPKRIKTINAGVLATAPSEQWTTSSFSSNTAFIFDKEVWKLNATTCTIKAINILDNDVVASRNEQVSAFFKFSSFDNGKDYKPDQGFLFKDETAFSEINTWMQGLAVAPNPHIFMTIEVDCVYFETSTNGLYETKDSYPTGVLGFNEKSLIGYLGRSTVNFVDFRYSSRQAENYTASDFAGCNSSQDAPVFVDVQNYMPTNVALVISDSSKILAIEGQAGQDPKAPIIKDEDLLLANVIVPGTTSVSDYVVVPNNANRYTMAAIGSIDSRLRNVEYYLTLMMAEQDAINRSITNDASGNPMFVNGIAIEDFKTLKVIDATNSETACSFNPSVGRMTPVLHTGVLKFQTATGDKTVWMPDSNEVQYVSTGELATKMVSVNPYYQLARTGNLEIIPLISDDSDTTALPSLSAASSNKSLDDYKAAGNISNASTDAISRADQLEASGNISNLADTNNLIDFSTWLESFNFDEQLYNRVISSNLSVIKARIEKSVEESVADGLISKSALEYVRKTPLAKLMFTAPGPSEHLWGSKSTTVRNQDGSFTTTYNKTLGTSVYIPGDVQSGTTVVNTVDDTNTSSQSTAIAANYVTDVSLKPYIANSSRTLIVKGMPASVELFIYVDGIKWNKYCSIVDQMQGSDVYTDSNGEAAITMLIPAATLFVGSHSVIVTTSSSFSSIDEFSPKATSTFYAQSVAVKTAAVPSTFSVGNNVSTNRAPALVALSGSFQFTETVTPSLQNDPVAQTFKTPSYSAYVSSVELYFATKGNNSDNLFVELRETVNGIPSVVLARKNIDISTVMTSVDATVPHVVSFATPVRLKSDTVYALVVGGSSPETRVWTRRIGENDVNTGQLVSTNSFTGTLMKSQDGNTWTAENLEDLKMRLLCLKFTSLTSSVSLNAYGVQPSIQIDKIQTFNGSSNILLYAAGVNAIKGAVCHIRSNGEFALCSGTAPSYKSSVSKDGIACEVENVIHGQDGKFLVKFANLKGGKLTAGAASFTTATQVDDVGHVSTHVNMPASKLGNTRNGSFVIETVSSEVATLPGGLTLAQLLSNFNVLAALGSDVVAITVPGFVASADATFDCFKSLREFTIRTHKRLAGSSLTIPMTIDNCVIDDKQLSYSAIKNGVISSMSNIVPYFEQGVMSFDNDAVYSDGTLSSNLPGALSQSFKLDLSFKANSLYDGPMINIERSKLEYYTHSVNQPIMADFYSIFPNSSIWKDDTSLETLSQMKATTIPLNFSLPFKDVRVIIDAIQKEGFFTVLIRTVSREDTVGLEAMPWIKLGDFTENSIDVLASKALELNDEKLNAYSVSSKYNTLQVKVLCKAASVTSAPAIDNIRIIALT